jgi:dihydrofolate synthase/folylpolyglutamate synthase
VTYQNALDFLYPLHRFGIKPGLESVRNLLDHFGSPDKRLGLVVHIAGTNGKGTVAAALASIFQASGKKTALYTSPHLVDFTERMRINGTPISQDRVAHYCSLLKESAAGSSYTFFEATTAMAFAWFADEKVDVSIVETGMGGRLDATNVLESDYAVISTISFDHTDWLGDTLALIAAEKAAIIKKSSKAFTAVMDPEAFQPIFRAAALCDAALSVAGKDALWSIRSEEVGELQLDVRTASGYYPALKVPLTGSFHASNITLAVMIAEDAGVGAAYIYSGLEGLLQTGYRGRLEKIGTNPAVLLDVSHNHDGIRQTVNAIVAFRKAYRQVYVIFGLASDKDAHAVIEELARLECIFIAVNIPSERTVPAEKLALLCRHNGAEAMVFDTGREALDYLRKNADPQDLILITGSFYLAGDIISALN